MSSTTSPPVRVGVIGAGQIGQYHLATYGKIPDAKVVAIADVNEAAARASAQQYGVNDTYGDFRKMLARDDIDAVDVCLHNNLHNPVTIAALEAGKHVYCEKPMAGTYRDAEAMLETARRCGRKLHIQLITIFHNETRAAKKLIDAGELGELYHARAIGFRRRGRPFVDGYGSPAFVQKRNAGGGALYDMGVYRISQMLYLLGNPKVIRVSGKTYDKIEMDQQRRKSSGYDVEEMGLGFIRFERDLTLDLIEAWAAHLDSAEGSCILGSKGGVRLQPFGFYRNIGDLDINATANLATARNRWGDVSGETEAWSDPQMHWIAALKGQVDLMPSAEIALNTMLISEGIYQSDQAGRELTADEIRDSSISTAPKIHA